MSDPTEAEIATFEAVRQVMAAGVATLESASWDQHEAAIGSVQDITTTFYLRTEPGTGKVTDRNIWPNWDTRTFNFGCFRATVEPLVAQFEAMVAGLAQFPLKGQDKLDLEHMQARAQKYREAINSSLAEGPSKRVWERVTCPLLVGWYPSDFADAGIQDTSVRSPPDLIKPYTLGFQIALVAEAQREAWAALGWDMLANARSAISWTLALPGRAADAAIDAGRAIGRNSKTIIYIVAAGAGVTLGAYLLQVGRRR